MTRSILQLAAGSNPLADTLAERLEEVSILFERQLASELSAVNSLCRIVEQYRGKMLRPTLVLVSGIAASHNDDVNKTITDQHITVAAVVEMIHMATLVHDDVLDEADVRRRGATVNHLRGNEAAVMLGDYLISNSFYLCSKLNDPRINLALGAVTNKLCEGELVQLHHRDNAGLDEQTYFEIIHRKTASLIAECCRLGATLSHADETIADTLHRFGHALGTAFQIQDDLLDLAGDTRLIGKPTGKDLGKGKITLPVVYHLTDADQTERGRVLRLIEQGDTEALARRLSESGAVNRAAAAARDLVKDAQHDLDTIPPGPARDMLHTMAEAVVTRNI